ncbi:MAG: hypothetical protein ACI9IA_000587, partial [Enterobacterales bacterium]
MNRGILLVSLQTSVSYSPNTISLPYECKALSALSGSASTT